MPTIVFRSTPARVLAVAVAAVAVGALVSLAVDGVASLARWGVLTGAVVAWTWAAYWQPDVVLDAHGIRIGNVWRIVRVPWGAVRGVDTTWSLTVVTESARWSAWAAPRSSGLRRRAASARSRWNRSDAAEDAEPGVGAEGADGGRTVANASAENVAMEIAAHLPEVTRTAEPVVVTWRTTTVLLCVGLTVAGVALAIAVP